MGEKYGVTVVKTADITIDLDEAREYLATAKPEALAELEADGDLAGIAEIYVSFAEGNTFELDFDREFLTYALEDSHVGTTRVEIEACVYCGSPRLTRDATVDVLTGEVRGTYDGVFCRDCEEESEVTCSVTVGLDFDPDHDFYKET